MCSLILSSGPRRPPTKKGAKQQILAGRDEELHEQEGHTFFRGHVFLDEGVLLQIRVRLTPGEFEEEGPRCVSRGKACPDMR